MERVVFEWEGGVLSGEWYRAGRSAAGVLLAHGAGGDMHTPGLVAYAGALAAGGVHTVRFNFPYVEAKRKIPDGDAAPA